MSLINKMLQDLDARGSQAGAALPSDIKPVMAPERRLPVLQIAIGASVAVCAIAVGGYFWLKARAPAPAAVVVATPAINLPPRVVARPTNPITVVETGPVANTPQPVVALEAAPVPGPVPVNITQPAAVPRKAQRIVRVVEAAVEVQPARVPSAPVAGGRDMNVTQQAESQYRQASAALEEGRVAAAMEKMHSALRLNPRHDAARQSLVALLIEAGRNDEAMQQLEQALAIDAGQSSLAMLLARMQIERGMSGVATLQRSLPAAQGNGEYHAFLAGALQREGRNREAIDHYGAALRTSPEHGVWLMGLGISLQAEKRNAEALAAYQRSKASGMLTPQLMAFVERKIQSIL